MKWGRSTAQPRRREGRKGLGHLAHLASNEVSYTDKQRIVVSTKVDQTFLSHGGMRSEAFNGRFRRRQVVSRVRISTARY